MLSRFALIDVQWCLVRPVVPSHRFGFGAAVALEAIAGKVERLKVHNRTEGLMTDLMKLRE